MTRFASLDSLLRILITGLILSAVFALARSSPSALRSYEPPVQNGAPALRGLSTPSVARLLVAPDTRPIAGPAGSPLRWSGVMDDDSVELTGQPLKPAAPAVAGSGPAVGEPVFQGVDNRHKVHGGLTE